MKTVDEIHNRAMELYDEAFIARHNGNQSTFLKVCRDALSLESEAAYLLKNKDLEPTRGILFRSAATMAFQCQEYREAERLCAQGLAGNPPERIAEEIRTLLDQINFHRHLEVKGVELQESDLVVSLAGPEVGSGIAGADVVVEKIQNTERLLIRTAERIQNEPYRERGAVNPFIKREIPIYMEAGIAASYAIVMRLGQKGQTMLPGHDFLGNRVIAEFLVCMELFERERETEIRERILDAPYYRNFIGLAHTLLPDGEKLNYVGFKGLPNGSAQRIELKKTMAQRARLQIGNNGNMPGQAGFDSNHLFEIQGVLKYADGLKKKDAIKIKSEDGDIFKIEVPTGMMSDIVRPLWDQDVRVVISRINKDHCLLHDIRKV